jgi:hypothetical protein
MKLCCFVRHCGSLFLYSSEKLKNHASLLFWLIFKDFEVLARRFKARETNDLSACLYPFQIFVKATSEYILKYIGVELLNRSVSC